MKIPSSITIKGKTWKIIKKDLGDNCGLCYSRNRTIIIDTKLKKEEIRPTILHEILHAVLFEYGFNQTELTGSLEELIVENIANELDEIFRSMSFR